MMVEDKAKRRNTGLVADERRETPLSRRARFLVAGDDIGFGNNARLRRAGDGGRLVQLAKQAVSFRIGLKQSATLGTPTRLRLSSWPAAPHCARRAELAHLACCRSRVLDSWSWGEHTSNAGMVGLRSATRPPLGYR